MSFDFFKILRLKGFPVNKAQQQLQVNQELPDLFSWQKRRQWEIFDYHFNHTPFYTQYIKSKPASWNQIPIMTKNELNQINYKRPFLNIFNPHFIRQTSGSTGRPFIYSIDYFSHAYTWLLISDRYSSLGLSLNDKQARFYGLPHSFPLKAKELIKDKLANRVHLPIMDLSEPALNKWLVTIIKQRFIYLYGYSYPLIAFAKYLNQNKIVLSQHCPQLKACIVTSEMCSPEEEALMESAFGIPVANEYGASELGIIGFGKTNDWLVSDEQILVEIVDDNNQVLPDGETGRIICTNLFNTATPFIRYEVGDIGKIEIRNNRRYLTQLFGRKEEMIYLPSGKKAPGDTVFFYIIQDFLRKYPGAINEYRVIQHALSSFEFQLTTNHTLTLHQEKLLKRLTIASLENNLNITITEVKEIERTALGKFRRFISMLAE